MKKQCVVRTTPTQKGYLYEPKKMSYLQEKLNDGWVVMCNKISDELEYILEKEVSNNESQ